MPAARAFCAMRATLVSTSFGAHIMRSANSSMTTTMYGSRCVRRGHDLLARVGRLGRLRRHGLVDVVLERARRGVGGCAQLVGLELRAAACRPSRCTPTMSRTPMLREQIVAALHLLDRPAQREVRLLRIGDDRQQQMRDALVDRELEHLRVDHDHADVFGRCSDRAALVIIALTRDRLAGARGAGDEQVRHAREVDDGRRRPRCPCRAPSAASPRPLRNASSARISLRKTFSRRLVRHLDADGGLAGNRRDDAHAQRLEREREVVGEVDDLVDARARAPARTRTS